MAWLANCLLCLTCAEDYPYRGPRGKQAVSKKEHQAIPQNAKKAQFPQRQEFESYLDT